MKLIKYIYFFTILFALSFTQANAQKHKKGKVKQAATSSAKKKTAKKVGAKKGKSGQKFNVAAKTPASKIVLVSDTQKTPLQETAKVLAQVTQDSGMQKEVVITSSFKPSLRNAAKVNFTAATPLLDTNRLPLTYNIPSQNLLFNYKPAALKPLALQVDSGYVWENKGYVKVGYGNFSAPYAEAGIGFGDGKKSNVNVHGKYISAKGNLPFQEYSKAGLDVLGVFSAGINHEITSKLSVDRNTQYKYGYQPTTQVFTKKQLQQNFTDAGFELGLQNKMVNSYGISYHPQVSVHYFADNNQAQELSTIIKAPLNKAFNKFLALDINITANLTGYSDSSKKISNNIITAAPSVQFKTPNMKLNLGFVPAWDNQDFTLMPNITAEAKIVNGKFIFIAGWTGSYTKNTYQSLATINPFIQQPTAFTNTRLNEMYAGFKGSLGKHITYNTKLAFTKMNGAALFVNDVQPNNNQSFNVLYDPQIQAIRLHGELCYTLQEKLTITASGTYTKFTKISQYEYAYGLLPLEIAGSLRWKILKDVQLKSDLFFWDGSRYTNAAFKAFKLPAAIDLNTGIEFAAAPRLNVWIQANNLLNNRYQRWNQYTVLGMQLMGGIVYNFKN